MKRSIALLLLALPATHAETPTLSYGFSECIDNERTLYYYSDASVTCANSSDADSAVAKPPVHGLRCDVPCERGYFLGANFSSPTPVSGCEKCEQGKYSLGGGTLYSKRTGAWSTPLPIDVHTDCVTRNMYTGKWQSNCAPWNATHDGAMIASGDNSQIMERYEAARLFSTLRISATFVRDGSITYQYRVDAEAPFDGLVFTIDETAVTPLVSKTDGWSEASFEVAAGAHTFSWDYTKDYSGDAGADKAFLKVIEVVGTSFADTYCHPCGGDMTMSGGSVCKFCGANEYADAKSHSELDFTCYKCPAGTVSPKGSIGLASCVETRVCTTDDLVERFTPCVNGSRTATYAWSVPPTCDPALNGSIALPKDQHRLACATCARGYVLTDDDTCERCPPGQKLADHDDACSKCPVGQVAVNAMAFGAGTPDGWSAWPAVVDAPSAQRAGWKLTRHGLAFAARSVAEEGEWSRPNRFALPFNATFVHSGFVNITYALSHVPTFASAGVRAWLELEVSDRDAPAAHASKATGPALRTIATGSDDEDDDDDEDGEPTAAGTALGGDIGGNIAHLRHGAENGTFSEVVYINVTRATTKQFELVLRTTSPVAERLVRAHVLALSFLGTADGAAVTCSTCPAGYEAFDGDSDDDASSAGPSCRICPAGTFAALKKGVAACEACPANTYSAAGAADACEPCGANTFSVGGAASCAAPSILVANASAASGAASPNASAAASSSIAPSAAAAPSYDLSQLESLIWGNDSFVFSDATADAPTAANLLSASAVVPSGVKVDSAHTVFLGLFRPVAKPWKEQVQGQIVDELVDAARDRPYVIDVTMLNPRDAGHFFAQQTARYGEVECAAPAQWRVTSGGNRMAILPLANGSGVQVQYTGGSRCPNGKAAATQIDFVCDLRAGTAVAPTSSVRDDAACKTTITWKTAFACPVCDASYFSELRSACAGGEQSVTYTSERPCYGGAKPASVPIATCHEVVLDTKAMYTVYAAVSLVGIVVLVLLAAVFVTHRKYRTAYNEYLYLKGRMPTTVATTDDGSKETTFEFANSASAPTALSPAAPSTRAGADSDGISDAQHEDETKDDAIGGSGIELSVRSV